MMSDLDSRWRTSSRSGTSGGNCVELARDEQGLSARDSKAPNSGMLSFTDASASAWLSAVKVGRFDR